MCVGEKQLLQKKKTNPTKKKKKKKKGGRVQKFHPKKKERINYDTCKSIGGKNREVRYGNDSGAKDEKKRTRQNKNEIPERKEKKKQNLLKKKKNHKQNEQKKKLSSLKGEKVELSSRVATKRDQTQKTLSYGYSVPHLLTTTHNRKAV